jgi:hypothetical protein
MRAPPGLHRLRCQLLSHLWLHADLPEAGQPDLQCDRFACADRWKRGHDHRTDVRRALERDNRPSASSTSSCCRRAIRCSRRRTTWYGKSVGHYEGDTLVIDTVGLNDKTFVDEGGGPENGNIPSGALCHCILVNRGGLLDGVSLWAYHHPTMETFSSPPFGRPSGPSSIEHVGTAAQLFALPLRQ